MEEDFYSLVTRNNDNDIYSLAEKKDDLRKKLFEKFDYCKYSKDLENKEIKFFIESSKLMDDKEFDKVLNKYLKLLTLKNFIIDLRKED